MLRSIILRLIACNLTRKIDEEINALTSDVLALCALLRRFCRTNFVRARNDALERSKHVQLCEQRVHCSEHAFVLEQRVALLPGRDSGRQTANQVFLHREIVALKRMRQLADKDRK